MTSEDLTLLRWQGRLLQEGFGYPLDVSYPLCDGKAHDATMSSCIPIYLTHLLRDRSDFAWFTATPVPITEPEFCLCLSLPSVLMTLSSASCPG